MTQHQLLPSLPSDGVAQLVMDGFVSFNKLPAELDVVVMSHHRQVRDEDVCWVTHVWLDDETHDRTPGGAA